MRRKYDKQGIYKKADMRLLLYNWRKYNRILETKGQRTLFDEYGRPSEAKQNAWDCCERVCKDFNGFGLSVISATCNKFTAGFEFYNDDTELQFMYISKERDSIIAVDDLIAFNKLIQEELLR